jgi:hypothetical protein
MRATGNYTQARITNKLEKEAYIEGMRICIELVSNYEFSRYLDEVIVDACVQYSSIKKNPFFSFAKPKDYYEMAYKQTLDIIASIDKRFVSGSADTDPRMYRYIEIDLYSNDRPF